MENEQSNERQPILNPLSCTDCGAGPYTDMRGLSSHRRFAHGVQGVSRGVPPRRPARATKPREPQAVKKSTAIVQKQAPQVLQKTDSISPELVGYAMGKLESLAQQIAHDNNVPEKAFVPRVAEYFAVLSKR